MARTPGAIGRSGPRMGRPPSTDSPNVPVRVKTRVLQERALPLLAEGLPLETICERVGVSKKTLYRWMSEEKFAAELDSIHEEMRSEAMRLLRGSAVKTAESLIRVATSGDQYDGPKVKAAELHLALIGIAPKKEIIVEQATAVQLYTDEELREAIKKGAVAAEITMTRTTEQGKPA